jgi:hypothetical protein
VCFAAVRGLSAELGARSVNGIHRVGQKVICTQDHVVWANFCCDQRWPIQDEIYTVTGFAEVERGLPGVFLLELANVNCECCSLTDAPWPLQCFRAIDETDDTMVAMYPKADLLCSL